MGEASGRFTYIEDPDGTLIEFVETHKVPVVARIGLYIDMNKRDKITKKVWIYAENIIHGIRHD